MTITNNQTINLAKELGIELTTYINNAGVLDMAHLQEDVMAAYHEAHMPLIEMAEQAHMDMADAFDAMTDDDIEVAI